MIAACAPRALAGGPPPWELVWADEFDGTSLDPARWFVENAFLVKNNELQYYAPDDVIVAGGRVTLRSQRRNYAGKQYTSGLIDTHGRFSFRYGRVEGRMRIPRGKGIWPAFWMLPEDGRWPPEIDIMESIGVPSTVYLTHHYGNSCTQLASFGSTYTGPDYSNQFSTFAVEWTPGRIDWYIDGVLRRSTTTLVPDVPMYIILNTAVGGDFPGNPDGTTVFPQFFDIDYVRVYKRADLPPEPPPLAGYQNGGFEICGGVTNSSEPTGSRQFWGWNNTGNTYRDTNTKRTASSGVKMFGPFIGVPSFSSLSQYYPSAALPGQRWRMEGFVRENSNDQLAGANSLIARISWANSAGAEIGATEQTVLTAAAQNDTWLAFGFEGVAPSGTAQARAQFRFMQPSGGAGAAFIDDVTFAIVPCRADYNADGQLTPADIFAFLNAFFARDFGADYDGNTFLEPTDIFAFLNGYFARCP